MSQLAERLKELRSDLNLTQEELAKKLNVARSTLASWETGRRMPDAEQLTTIAQALDASIDYLLGITNEREFKSMKEKLSTSSNNLLGPMLSALKDRGLIVNKGDNFSMEDFALLLLTWLSSVELEEALERIDTSSPLYSQFKAFIAAKRNHEVQDILNDYSWIEKLSDDLRNEITDFLIEIGDLRHSIFYSDSYPNETRFNLNELSLKDLEGVTRIFLDIHRLTKLKIKSDAQLVSQPIETIIKRYQE